MKRLLKLLWIVMAATLVLFSCKKENDNPPTNNGENNETPTQELSSAKRILTFKFVDLDVTAVIDHNERTVAATVPYGTNVSSLTPEIMVSKKAEISPASGVAMDFTSPVIYTVTAENGSQAVYTATVIVEEPTVSNQPFVGTWGAEKIEYYNIDYAGNPIAGSMTTYSYDPYDIDNGIQLVFKEDKTGELRDSSIDTIWVDWNDQTQTYDSYIVCPDTTLVKQYTYSYDASSAILYMNVDNGNYVHTYRMTITFMDNESFIYENVYGEDQYDNEFVEKAYLKRLSYTPTKSEKPMGQRPIKSGSLLGKR